MSYTIYNTQAVVVDGWPYKDASRRLLVYSKQLGRILVRAQAVRKLKSKLAPAVQPYAQSDLELVYGKSGWRLVGAQPQTNFYLASQAGQSAIRRTTNLLTRLVPAQQSDEHLYTLIINGLSALKEADPSVVQLAERLFVFRLLAHLGYAPDPSARNLSRFTNSQTYKRAELSDFQSVEGQAVGQINQALQSTQL